MNRDGARAEGCFYLGEGCARDTSLLHEPAFDPA